MRENYKWTNTHFQVNVPSCSAASELHPEQYKFQSQLPIAFALLHHLVADTRQAHRDDILGRGV